MIRVVEGFAGIGSQKRGLVNAGIEHEIAAILEVDKHAINSYKEIHGDVLNLGDICDVKTKDVPDHDLFTYSFPCQAISSCGKRSGLKKGSGTSSSLLWECEKIIKSKRPRYLLMENVKTLINKDNIEDFKEWLNILEELGYNTYYDVLDAKNYGVPQHRERVYAVSILKEYDKGFEFPKPYTYIQSLNEFVDDDFEELIHTKIMKSCIDTFRYNYNEIIKSDKEIYQCECSSGFQDKKVGIKVSPTLRANKNHTCVLINSKIKRLSAKDMVRLTGFTNDDYDKMSEVCSDTQIAKQCGNSIVVNVLTEIFKCMFNDWQIKK